MKGCARTGRLSIAPEVDQKPLDSVTIRRIFAYTKPYRRLRNALLGLVLLRSVQLPLVTWTTAKVISGPIAQHDVRGTVVGVCGFLALSGFTSFCFIYRQRFALSLGEAVVHDLRAQVYAHLLRLPMSFFKKVQVGKLIGRITSDVDVVRVGVQDVAFIGIVQVGSMLVSSGLMLYYDWKPARSIRLPNRGCSRRWPSSCAGARVSSWRIASARFGMRTRCWSSSRAGFTNEARTTSC